MRSWGNRMKERDCVLEISFRPFVVPVRTTVHVRDTGDWCRPTVCTQGGQLSAADALHLKLHCAFTPNVDHGISL